MPLLTKPISSIQLAEMLGLKHVGRNQKILHVSTLDNPKKNSLFSQKWLCKALCIQPALPMAI